MTREEIEMQEAEEAFKRMFLKALVKAGEDASVDEDGFIVVRRPVENPPAADKP